MIPLFHDFEGESVVVVGGGAVALRKARRFAREAEVTVVAPEFDAGFDAVDCDRRQERVTPDHPPPELPEARLVVPATDDPELNEAVATAAEREGCLVNRVDEAGEVVVPSCVRSEEVSVAISTRGSSPAMAKHLRRRLTPLVSDADGMVRLQRELRADLKETVDSGDRRARLLWSVVESDAVWDLLPDEYERARATARDLVGL